MFQNLLWKGTLMEHVAAKLLVCLFCQGHYLHQVALSNFPNFHE